MQNCARKDKMLSSGRCQLFLANPYFPYWCITGSIMKMNSQSP